ncbi:Hypothetical protein POVR2_LOCUS388 [uncultured virus]|nr:Hypothetical protein POVR2_LOCUS388 [uncultured virus]
MQNRDILSVMAPKLDEGSLLTLYQDRELRASLKVILSSNHYWHARAEYLAGKQLVYRALANWKQVYYSTKSFQEEEWQDVSDIAGLEELLGLQEATGGFEKDEDLLHDLLSLTSSLDIFEYALARTTDVDLFSVLRRQLGNSREITDRVLSLMPADIGSEDDLAALLSAAIRAERRDVFDRFEKFVDEDTDMNSVFDDVMYADNVEMYDHLLTVHELEIEERMYKIAIEHDAVEILKFIIEEEGYTEDDMEYFSTIAMDEGSLLVLDYLETLIEIDWTYALEQYARLSRETYRQVEVLRHALTRIKNNDLSSFLVGLVGNVEVFTVLFEDPRSHPESILSSLVQAAEQARHSSKLIRLVVLDPRIRVEEIDDQSALIILKHLPTKDNAMIDQAKPVILDKKSTISRILRQIVFKRPTAIELLDWMIAQHDPDIATAAASVLDSKLVYSRTVAPIRALLLSLLYPTLSLEQAIASLFNEDYIDSINKSELLLSAWYATR